MTLQTCCPNWFHTLHILEEKPLHNCDNQQIRSHCHQIFLPMPKWPFHSHPRSHTETAKEWLLFRSPCQKRTVHSLFLQRSFLFRYHVGRQRILPYSCLVEMQK